jgi:transposase
MMIEELNLPNDEYSSKDLDHLGLVAGMCRTLGLAQIIDEILPPDPRSTITHGECCELMCINGLGFTSRPLYLEAQFFGTKAVSRLLGRPVAATEISDDRLARSLDALYKVGCDRVFERVSSRAVTRFNINTKFRHLDTTSMHVHGEYDGHRYEPGIGLVEFGYSKDHRPDIKQFMISLMSSSDGDVPLLAKTIAGNTSDKTHFQEVLKELEEQIKDADYQSYYVADSAMYTASTLKTLSDQTLWISRPPASLKAVKEACAETNQSEMEELATGYFGKEIDSDYGGVAQRWLIIYSEKAYEREKKTLNKRIAKAEEGAGKELKKLKSMKFLCEKDAKGAIERLSKKLPYHNISQITIQKKNHTEKRGRPSKQAAVSHTYQVDGELLLDEEARVKQEKQMGKFIIATNERNKEALTKEELLNRYKDQQAVERGFRFLKDPFFLCSSIFLKKETRIVALGMVMCLCLLIYMLTQRLVREKLKEQKQKLPNQLGKPTDRPTIRWIFQVFEGVHVIYHRIGGELRTVVANIKKFHQEVLNLLGGVFATIYKTG